MNNNSADQYLSYPTYNYQHPGPDEVIAPFIVTSEQIEIEHMNPKSIRYWKLHGTRRVLVSFMVVKKDKYPEMMKLFNYMASSSSNYASEPTVSFDPFMEDLQDPDRKGTPPAMAPSAEEVFLASAVIDDLISEVTAMDEKSGAILSLLRLDCPKKDILREMKLGKTQGYSDIHKAQQLARSLWNACL